MQCQDPNLVPIEYRYDMPGTTRPYALIRRVDVERDGVPVRAWRAVTHE